MLSTAYEPLKLGPITLPNRFIKAGANENMSKKGRPTRAMRMHHEELVKGGVGMTTMAYVAVEKDGRTLPDQVWIHDCLLYTSPSPRDLSTSRMPSSA